MSPTGHPGLPPLLSRRRRRWLMALLANGAARALLAAIALVGLRVALAGSPAAAPWLAAGLAAGFGVSAWLQRRETLDAEALAQHYIAHVRLRLFDRLSGLTPAETLRHSRGGVLMRFVGDVQALRAWVGRGIAQGMVAATTLVLLWALLVATDPRLGLLALAALAAGAGAAALHWEALYAATALARRRQAAVAAYMQDRIAGLGTLQAAGRARTERLRLRRLHLRLRRALQARADWRGRHRAVAALTGGTLLAMLAWQGGTRLHAALPGGMTGGVLGSALLVLLMLPAVRTLAQAADAWVAARVARARLTEFLARAAPETGPPMAAAPDPAGDAGDAADAPVLRLEAPRLAGRVHGPVAEVAHGRRIALCGPTGSGKSALLMLLAGLEAADTGCVRLGGERVDALPDDTRRRRLVLLSPDLPLLRGSIGDNLHYQSGGVARRTLDQALHLSGLAALLPGLPAGLDTPVRDAGMNLSHGQRRAVQLARALAARPAVLLIDDPAACLPGPVEDRLGMLIDAHPGTIVFATADPALAVLADEIWTFQAGERIGAWPVQHRRAPVARAGQHDGHPPP